MQRELCARIAHTLAAAPVNDHLGYEALAHLKLPGADYRHVLRFLHLALRPKLYVEIGVRDGGSLDLVQAGTRCVAIDPAPAIATLPPNVALVVSTSDNFFAHEPNRENCRGFDLAFIDGDHSFDQALRDFENLEALAKPTSIICLHDVIPMDARTATPKAETSFHTGDVWRLMATIVAERTDLVAFTVACPPSGLGIIGHLGEEMGVHSDLFRDVDVDMDWDWLASRLNIVANDGRAIGAALKGKR